MLNYMPALFVAFCASILTIKVLLPLAPQIGLVDLPNDRKIHNGAIPLIGGISIFTAVLISSTLFIQQSHLLNLYLISSALLVFIGTLDDMYDLSVTSRIIFQGLVACIMVFGAGIYITDLGNVFGVGNITLGNFGMIFTTLACIALINAFNMVDGIDGLAGSMSIVTVASIALLNALSLKLEYILLPLILVVSIVPFVFYNVSTRNPRGKKIFMGDAGSMFMGLTVIWLLTLGTQGDDKSFRPVTALWIVAVPLMDMITIMFRRLRDGASPFRADNGHFHHICIKFGLTSRQTLWFISCVSIVFSSIGVLGEMFNVAEQYMLIGFVLSFLMYVSVLQSVYRKLPKHHVVRKS